MQISEIEIYPSFIQNHWTVLLKDDVQIFVTYIPPPVSHVIPDQVGNDVHTSESVLILGVRYLV